MSNLNEFLKTDRLHLTLTNEQGEFLQAGPADYVKALKSRAVIRWNIGSTPTNNFPFTIAVLHGAKKVFDTLFIKAALLDTETVIEMEY